MPRNTKRKYRQVVDYIEDEVGVDIPRDVKKMAIESVDGDAASNGVPANIEKIGGTDQSAANLMAALQSVADNDELRIAIETDNEGLLKTGDQPLDASSAEIDIDINSQSLSQVSSDIEQIGGQAQSAVDVANKIDQINAALASVGSESLRVTSPNPLDVSGAEVDVDIATQSLSPLTVTDDGSLNIEGVVSIQEDTPLDVSATTVPTDPNTSDSASLNSATLAADGELVMSLSASSADSILGQVRSSGSFNVVVRWKNSSGTVIREETIKNNTSGGSWADIDQPAKSAEADIVVSDTSSAEQTVDATVHTG